MFPPFFLLLSPLLQAVPPPPDLPHQSEAVELLHRAAKLQNSARNSAPVTGFHLSLNIRERNQSRNDFDLELNFDAQGERIRIVVEDANRGTRLAKGFDGKAYWLKEPKKPILFLDGREFSQDRDAIEQAIEFSNHLLLLLDFKHLPKACEELSLIHSDEGKWIRGFLPLQGQKSYFFLLLNPKTLLADKLRIGVPARNEDGGTLLKEGKLVFSQLTEYELLHYRSFAGLQAPQVIREFLLLPEPIQKTSTEVDPNLRHPSRIVEVHNLNWQKKPNTSPPKTTD